MIVEQVLVHLAGEAAPSFDGGLADWLKLGGGIGGGSAMAALAWALFTDRLVNGKRLREALAERDRERAEKDALTKLMMDEIVPLGARNVDVLKAIDSKLAPSGINLTGGRG